MEMLKRLAAKWWFPGIAFMALSQNVLKPRVIYEKQMQDGPHDTRITVGVPHPAAAVITAALLIWGWKTRRGS